VAENIERNFVNVLGLKTFYAKIGSGVPVILIHGGSPGTCSLLNWKPNFKPLADAGFAVYAFDQPGFGDTEAPQDHSMEFRVTHAKAFVEALGLGKRFHPIGNSMGAYIAARLALECPGAGQLILVSSTTLAPKGSEAAQAMAQHHVQELRGYEPTLEHMRKLSQGTFFRKELVTEDFVQERYAMSHGWRFDAMRARIAAPGARPLVSELGKISNETLILWGADDKGAALERALLLFSALPKAELHVFGQCAHWVHWDQADRFNRLVTDFLGR
jgi:2-hydroxy-6-oxonona-2,4-dienedioate hydrolase